MVPYDGFIKDVMDLTRKYQVLFIADEVQCGLGRSGTKKASDFDLEQYGMKPDIVTLGKALSGGFTPASGIVADREVMDTFTEGNHGSTFGGNPLTMAIAKAAIQVIIDEGLVENAKNIGAYMRKKFSEINSPLLKDVRGRGFMNAIEVDSNSYVTGVDLCNIF